MANRIQLRRDTAANWTRVNPVLEDGEPGLEIDSNRVKYGDGNTAWNVLAYASGGLTDVAGIVTFPGNLQVGTLHAGLRDQESVVWATEDSEYMALWYGGNIDASQIHYGPRVSISAGNTYVEDGPYVYSEGHHGYQVNIDVGINNWNFDDNGVLTLPDGGYIDNNGGITRLGAAGADGAQIGSSDTQNYVTASNVGVTIQTLADSTNSNWTFGTDGILTMPPGNETTAGWIRWSHASDDLTNVAGAGFIDYFNAYTGLGLTAPTNTNAEKGIWFGTPADPTSPFQPETSMVFRNDTLYLPKNGFIKSHDINRVGYANLTTVGTNVTIQTNDEYDWTFGSNGKLTLPGGGTITSALGSPQQGLWLGFNGHELLLNSDGQFWTGGLELGGSGLPGYVGSYGNITLNTNIGTGPLENQWLFGTDGNLTLPQGSSINDNASAPGFNNGQAVEITPGGASNANQLLKIYPTVPNPDGNHLHLTSGDLSVTDLFLGDDNQFLQIAADGNVCIGTYGTSGNFWQFGTDGNLTIPGNLILPAGGQIQSPAGVGNVTIEANDGNNIRVWTFGANGNLAAPLGGNITVSGGGKFIGDGSQLTNLTVNQASNIIGSQPNVTLVAGSYSYLFANTGAVTIPAAGSDEGGEIDFTKAPNSSLNGTAVVVDQYIDRLRFFENGGTNRGAYIDLSQTAEGVGTLLNNRVSAFVNAGTFVTMDNIKATVTTSSNRGLSLATVSGTVTCYISGTYGMFGGATVGGASAGFSMTTTPSASIFSWSFGSEGDAATYILNYNYSKSYRITMMIGGSFNNNMISIERLI